MSLQNFARFYKYLYLEIFLFVKWIIYYFDWSLSSSISLLKFYHEDMTDIGHKP